MADDNFDEDIFDDLYDDEPGTKPEAAGPPAHHEPEPEPVVHMQAEPVSEPAPDATAYDASTALVPKEEPMESDGEDNKMAAWNGNSGQSHGHDDNYGPINVKEDG